MSSAKGRGRPRRIATCFLLLFSLWMFWALVIMVGLHFSDFINHDAPENRKERSLGHRVGRRKAPMNCGCPNTCKASSLGHTAKGRAYSCQERVSYLMSHYGNTEVDACTAASKGAKPFCEPECDPQRCEEPEVQEAMTRRVGDKKLLIIASAPKDEKHSVALWSELECMTGGFDKILLAVPDWSKDLVEFMVDQAKEKLSLNVHARYFVNDRYDVGLWCDALDEVLVEETDEYESIVLLNDSVYAMHQFTGILDKLNQAGDELDMVGLSYSNSGGSFWLESVMRGFRSTSIDSFYSHSCKSRKVRYCKRLFSKKKRKRCIVDHLEMPIAGLYEPNRTYGLYPSDPPAKFKDGQETWVQNPSFWNDVLVNKLDFPVAKVNNPKMIRSPKDERLETCTRHMDANYLQYYDYTSYSRKAEEALKKFGAERIIPNQGPLPWWKTLSSSVPRLGLTTDKCWCVDCVEDTECGGLWKGDAVGGDPYSFKSIQIVVSHCLHSLDWLPEFIGDFPVRNVTIISKCERHVEGAPKGSTIVRLPNVGRCDHSYAHWIANKVKNDISSSEEDEVVVFLKDDRSKESIHQPGVWRSLYDMLRIASKAGFACGMHPTLFQDDSLSSYHEVSHLTKFNYKTTYKGADESRYDSIEADEESFESKYADLGHWAAALGLDLPKDLINVCYAGTFAATTAQIRKRESAWGALERSLARGNNIEEGHFAERSWAGLLSNSLTSKQIMALRNYSHEVLDIQYSVVGALQVPMQQSVDQHGLEANKRTLVSYSGPTSVDLESLPEESRLKHQVYLYNFEHFLHNGGVNCSNHDTALVLTEPVVEAYKDELSRLSTQCSKEGGNIFVLTREERCYDMMSVYTVWNSDVVNMANYDYFIHVNCGMSGPSTALLTEPWTRRFTSKLSDHVKMVGLTYNCVGISYDGEPQPHIQSMVYSLDREGIDIVKKSGAVFDCGTSTNRTDIVNRYEMGMSKAIIDHKFGIASVLLPKILHKKNADECTIDDVWYSERLKRHFGRVPYLNETVFFKSSRFLTPDIVDTIGLPVDLNQSLCLSLHNPANEPNACEHVYSSLYKS